MSFFKKAKKLDFLGKVKPVKILQNGNGYLEWVLNLPRPFNLSFDYETTGIRPFRKGHEIKTVGVTVEQGDLLFPCSFPLGSTDVSLWTAVLKDKRIFKIAHNLKFEETWAAFLLKTHTESWVWDTMVAARIINNQCRTTALEDQAILHLGIDDYKQDTDGILRCSTKEKKEFGANGFNGLYGLKASAIPRNVLYRNALDGLYTMQLYRMQRKGFKHPDAYALFHSGLLALAEIESAGTRIDVDYMRKTDVDLQKAVERFERDIWRMRSVSVPWKRKYKAKINLNSATQQGYIFFDLLKIKPTSLTKGGKPCLDAEALGKIDHPLAKKITDIRQIEKIRGYMASYLREQTNGFIHPSYGLHTTVSFRSSCSDPNFQNVPVRNPVFGPMIRRSIVPRDLFHQIGEADYSALEVRIAACYHKDPEMLAYIKDPSKDMHKDMSCRCFLLKPEQVTKPIRFIGKNSFVFPQFYGSYWLNIAPAMWEAAKTQLLPDGTPLLEHLANQGITELGKVKVNKKGYSDPIGEDTFYAHLRRIEIWFWTKKFRVYAQWRKQWYDRYLEKGEFTTLTGFRCRGEMRRTEVINLPVQGSAFHCTLWSMTRIHNIYKKAGLDSRVLGQIHDSIVNDIHPPELAEVKKTLRKVMCEEVRDHFKWIIVPLDIEFELAPVGKSWNDKKECSI